MNDLNKTLNTFFFPNLGSYLLTKLPWSSKDLLTLLSYCQKNTVFFR